MDTGLMTSSDEDAVLATPLPTAAPRNARRNLAAQQQYIEQQTVAEWMSTIQFEGDIKLKIFRTEPQHWRNSQGTQSRIAGFLREYERPITEIDVQQEFGGGAYVISAWGKDNKAIGKAVSISIAGDPLVPLSALPAAAPRKDDDVSKALVTAVTQMSEKRSEELREALQNRKQDEAASTAFTGSGARAGGRGADRTIGAGAAGPAATGAAPTGLASRGIAAGRMSAERGSARVATVGASATGARTSETAARGAWATGTAGL